jgi:hypothetical protein
MKWKKYFDINSSCLLKGYKNFFFNKTSSAETEQKSPKSSNHRFLTKTFQKHFDFCEFWTKIKIHLSYRDII